MASKEEAEKALNEHEIELDKMNMNPNSVSFEKVEMRAPYIDESGRRCWLERTYSPIPF